MGAATGALIATHSGLRGRPGAGLDGDAVSSAVSGLLARMAASAAPPLLVLGRDRRPSGRGLVDQVAAIAAAAGVRVLELGVVTTPATKLAAREAAAGGAVMVTGSHLGADWNGLKLFAAPDFWPLDAAELIASGRRVPVAEPAPRRVLERERFEGADELHAAAVCAAVNADTIAAAGLRVGLSGGSGRAVVLALERLGCALGEEGADLVLRFDPDGDRLQIADERGRALDTEFVLPLVALSRRAKRVVRGADSSRMVELMSDAEGWATRVAAPGELHLLRRLAEWDAHVAGEGNGGVVVPEVGMARDALAASAAILELVARTGSPPSELVAGFPALERRRSTLPCSDGEAAERALAAAAERLASAPSPGAVLVERGEAWGLIRRSATEPVLRITVEAADAGQAEALHAEIAAALRR
jgi:phosphomannomutase